MSFNISLSGLSAMQKALDVTSNNIANVATTGFKSSRAEFADVYTTSVMANGRTTVGSGVQTAVVSQQFAQGAVESTNNTLDLAISGEGFFVMNATDSKENIYTRAGNFEIDEKGNVVSSSGYYLQVYDVNEDGTVKSMSLDSTKNLVIPSKAGSPTMTDKVTSSMNVNAEQSAIENDDKFLENVEKFDPTDSKTYSASTSVVIYDSLGKSHTLSYYYVKTDVDMRDKKELKVAPNTWNMYLFMDGKPVDVADMKNAEGETTQKAIRTKYTDNGTTYPINCAQVTFDEYGKKPEWVPSYIRTVALGNVKDDDTCAKILEDGADQNQTITIDNTLTQFAEQFSVTQLSQDGSTVGQLTGLDVNGKGLVCATYSNGTSVNIGMVAMATFANNQGLSKIGDTCWKESLSSGEAVPSRAGVGTTGTIKSSALESSNVDLSASLVQLIMAQRNYQANSKSLEASSNIMQTILNVS